jgi:DNA-binding response OmpR family regulator
MKNIIIAEDYPSLRNSYKMIIKSILSDIQIDEVETGEDLVKKVKENNYSFIITDNKMKGELNGLSAIKEIREFNKEIPIYLLSDLEEELAKNVNVNLGKYQISEFIEKTNCDIFSKLTEIVNNHLR